MLKIFCKYFIIFTVLIINTSFASAPKEEEVAPNAPVVPRVEYYELQPKFLTNLSASGGKFNYIKVKVTLMINDSRELPLIKEHDAALRDGVISVIGAATIEEAKTSHGKDQLQEKVQEVLTKITDERIGRRVIKKVLFSEYLVQ